ncbi:MAG: hypothetical protein K2Z81_21145, partial [Cyanobacteria bacterium]|nr:hypothetical protein [Cyanobacteriota bacterium]
MKFVSGAFFVVVVLGVTCFLLFRSDFFSNGSETDSKHEQSLIIEKQEYLVSMPDGYTFDSRRGEGTLVT